MPALDPIHTSIAYVTFFLSRQWKLQVFGCYYIKVLGEAVRDPSGFLARFSECRDRCKTDLCSLKTLRSYFDGWLLLPPPRAAAQAVAGLPPPPSQRTSVLLSARLPSAAILFLAGGAGLQAAMDTGEECSESWVRRDRTGAGAGRRWAGWEPASSEKGAWGVPRTLSCSALFRPGAAPLAPLPPSVTGETAGGHQRAQS